jgi:ABC-2 type transport system permease protein
MRVLDITLKDLTQIVRDWRAATFLLAMPIAFTLMFGFMFGGFSAGETDPRLPVAFLDQDGGQLSDQILQLLEVSSVIRPVFEVDQEVEKQVADEELAAAVIIPSGFSAGVVENEPIRITVIVDSSTTAGMTVLGEIQSVTNRLQTAVQTAQISTQTYQVERTFQDDASQQIYFTDTLERTIAAWEEPPINVKITQARFDQNGEDSLENAFAHSSPGMMAQFAIAGLIGAATIIVLERKSRALSRLLTTGVSQVEILLGHYLAMFVMIFVQFSLLTLFGQLFLQLGYYQQPLATLSMIIATALFSASLGLLIGTVAKTDQQVVVFSLIPMFVLAGLGGAWVPLEFTPETIQLIGHLSPVAWIMDGFKDILIRGAGFYEILLPVLVLLGFTIVCLALAVWRFKFE